MDAVWWDKRIETAVGDYVVSIGLPRTGRYSLILPSGSDIDGVGYENTLTEDGPINGMALQRVQKQVRCGSNSTSAPENRWCMQVGRRIFILIYEGGLVGNSVLAPTNHQCPFPNFHMAVLRDLRQMAETASGRALLTSIDNSRARDSIIVIRFSDGFSTDQLSKVDWRGPSGRDPKPGSLTATPAAHPGQPPTFTVGGPPAEALVRYNPMFFGLPKTKGVTDRDDPLKKGQWGTPQQKPPDVTLFHELIHADDGLRGIFPAEATVVRRNGVEQKLSEIRCVGLDEFGEEVDYGRPVTIYSENTYRKERGFVIRTYYTQPAETRGPGEMTEEKRNLLTYLDPGFLTCGVFVNPGLMTLSRFQRDTYNLGTRNKINEVEAVLRDYNENYGSAEPLERIKKLIQVIGVCHAYKRKPAAKRNVATLIEAAGAMIRQIVQAMINAMPHPPDETYFRTLRTAAGLLEGGMYNVTGPGPQPPYGDTDGEDGRRALSAAYDLLYRTGGGKLPSMQRPEVVLRTPPDENDLLSVTRVTALQREDVNALNAMCMDFQIPTVTISVIDEMLDVAGKPDVVRSDSRSGSSAGPTPTGHFVKWPQWNADDIRLATFIHELTHISTHRSFDNTPVMFSFALGKTAGEIREIQESRIRTIREMMDMVVDEAFNGHQRHWLTEVTGQHKGKLAYAISDGTAQVANTLAPGPPLDPMTGMASGPRPAPHAQWTALWSTIAPVSQVLWEYDTVINQCLIYMHMWKIPIDNALYVRLRTVGQELYDARSAARAQQVQAQAPPVVVQQQAPPPRQDVNFFQPPVQRPRAQTV